MNLANQIKNLTTYWDRTKKARVVLTLGAPGGVRLAFSDEKADFSVGIWLCHQAVGLPHADAIDAHQPCDIGPAWIAGVALFQQVK